MGVFWLGWGLWLRRGGAGDGGGAVLAAARYIYLGHRTCVTECRVHSQLVMCRWFNVIANQGYGNISGIHTPILYGQNAMMGI